MSDLTTRTHKDVTVTGPAGTWLTMTVLEEPDAAADLTEITAALLSIGNDNYDTKDSGSTSSEFATLECEDTVTFAIGGVTIPNTEALDKIACGISIALNEALSSGNPTPHN